jgi:hypothetical protein
MKLPGMLNGFGKHLANIAWVGERKALALLCLGFYTTMFFLITLTARRDLPEWLPVFVGMTAIYTLAFVGVAAEWFWGRWFAIGLGYWGVTMTGMAWLSLHELPPPLIFFGVTHALVALSLLGDRMATAFELKPGWRERWNLDEQGVLRVRKSVTRAASSLPALVMFALAPRESESLALLMVPALAVAGVVGLLSRRTWGVLCLGGAGALSAAAALLLGGPASTAAVGAHFGAVMPFVAVAPQAVAGFGALLLVAAAAPFVAPMLRYVRRR